MDDDYYCNVEREEKERAEIQKQQQILINNNKRLENFLYKKHNNLEELTKELTHMLEIFINNPHKNHQIRDDFLIRFKKVLLKFRRYEILNALFLNYEISSKVINEVSSFKNLDEEGEAQNAKHEKLNLDLIASFTSDEIHIKPLINFNSDFLKIKFNIRDSAGNKEVISHYLKNPIGINDLSVPKEINNNLNLNLNSRNKNFKTENKREKSDDKSNKEPQYESIYDVLYDLESKKNEFDETIEDEKSNDDQNIEISFADSINNEKDNAIKETNKSDDLRINANLRDFSHNQNDLREKYYIEKQISEIKENLKRIDLEKLEKKSLLNKLIKKVIADFSDKDTLNFFEINFDESKQILFLKSKSNKLVKIPEDKAFHFLSDDFENEISSQEAEEKRLFNKHRIDHINQNPLANLETQINQHIRLSKRNTKNLKQTYDRFEGFIQDLKTKNEFLNKNILKILPFGSYTQFSFNKKSDLEITLITNFLFDLVEFEKEKQKVKVGYNFNSEFGEKDKEENNNPNKKSNTFKNGINKNIKPNYDVNKDKNNNSEDSPLNETGSPSLNGQQTKDLLSEKLQKIKNERNSFIIQLENSIDDSDLYFKVEPHRTSRTYIIGFYDKKTLVKVELIIDNIPPLYNSNLIRNYCLIDSRVVIMLNFIKDWSKLRKINGNFGGNLSSYCFSMMVIFFLQKISPPVLPILQHKNLEAFEDMFFYDVWNKGAKYENVKVRHLFCNFEKNFLLENKEEISLTSKAYNGVKRLVKAENNKNFNSAFNANKNKNSITDKNKSNFKDKSAIANIIGNLEYKRFMNFKSKNEMTVAELVFNFFKFYLFYFDPRNYCIDIQHKDFVFRYANKYESDFEYGKEFVFIDPIDFDYNPGKYMEHKSNQSKVLKKEFYDALIKICECRKIIDEENAE